MHNITGGLIYISAQCDVIDSNGNIEMSGGVVFAQGPSRGGNGLLGFDGTFTFKGASSLDLVEQICVKLQQNKAM